VRASCSKPTPEPASPSWADADIATTRAVSLDTIAPVRRAFVEAELAAALHRCPDRTPRLRKLDGRAEAHLSHSGQRGGVQETAQPARTRRR
jgi:hypothetical protein